MAEDAASGGTGTGGPLRAAAATSPASVIAEAGNYEEDMIASGVDGDPAAVATGAVLAEVAGGNGRVEQAGGTQDERGGARTIVGSVELG